MARRPAAGGQFPFKKLKLDDERVARFQENVHDALNRLWSAAQALTRTVTRVESSIEEDLVAALVMNANGTDSAVATRLQGVVIGIAGTGGNTLTLRDGAGGDLIATLSTSGEHHIDFHNLELANGVIEATLAGGVAATITVLYSP